MTQGATMYRKWGKRLIDMTLSGLALAVLSPVIGIVWLWLTVANKGAGAIFTQPRPGRGGRVFRIRKFKTMTDERDAQGRLLPDERRLTRIGRIVRSTSLDELPQLWNVFVGDMSLIGPRPLLLEYLPLYTPEQARRHEVRPGISGWAQCHGRNAISWEQKFDYDVWYVDHLSLSVDLKVIMITLKKVIVRDGINQDGHSTMPPFTGTKTEGEQK